MALSRSRSGPRRSTGGPSELPKGSGSSFARCQTTNREWLQNRTGETLPDARAKNGGFKLTGGSNMATTREISAKSPIGRDTRRVDGPLKVTGRAQYASDFQFPGLLYGVPVEATIANGKVTKLDTATAEK